MPDIIHSPAADPRWKGDPGRMEVWYATLTDPASRTGAWIHYETVSPTREGGGDPYGHGWITVFRPDRAPSTARFGPAPAVPQSAGGPWFASADARAESGRMTGTAGAISWDLRWEDSAPPLWTFPEMAWTRELLPGAQTVVAPSAAFTGSISYGVETTAWQQARGAVAHIYSHGSAKRWGWLHADLGNDDVLEIVTAVSMSPGLNRVPPLAFLRLRIDGNDWPASPFPAVRTRTQLGLPQWSVKGHIGRRRIGVTVDQPPERCVSLEYTDPDGETAVCTNTEQADVAITIERRERRGWALERSWTLDGTGHAEVGLRGSSAPTINERTSP